MKKLVGILLLISCHAIAWGQEVIPQTGDLSAELDQLAFRPIELMMKPSIVQMQHLDQVIPIEHYSDKEREVQTLINERTADGIRTYSPPGKEKEWTSVEYEEITPFTWSWVDLELTKPDGH